MPPRAKKYTIPSEFAAQLNEKLNEYLELLNLTLRDDPQSRTTGKAVMNTVKAYEKHYRGFEAFLGRIGDVESMLVLSERAPTMYCPSMKPTSIAAYIRYKVMNKGTILKDFEEKVVQDLNGDNIICDGSWNEIGGVEQFLAAISEIHKLRRQDCQYVEPCNDCIKELENNYETSGCRFHKGEYRFWRKGIPRTAQVVVNARKEAARLTENHIVHGAYQILPSELRQIRDLLISSNSIEDLQIFCGIMISILMFLRHDEFADLELCKIKPELCVKKNGILEVLAIGVLGKTDKKWRTMLLWRKKRATEFCAFRHLLVYVYLAKIKDGYLFPDLKKGGKMKYSKLLNTLKKRFKNVLQRPYPITTHVFRKTGYLFAVFAQGSDRDNLDEIMKSARHSHYPTAQVYSADAYVLYQYEQINDPCPEMQVPEFQCCVVQNEASASVAAATNDPFTSLYDASVDFVKLLNLDQHPRAGPKMLVNAALLYTPICNNKQQLFDLLKEIVPRRHLGEITTLVSAVVQQGIRDAMLQNQEQDTGDNEAATTLTTISQTTRTRKRGGNVDIQLRHVVKKKKGQDVLDLMLQIQDQVPDNVENLTSAARAYYYNNVVPIVSCFKNHFNSDMIQFLQRHPLQNGVYTFKKKSCNGREDCK
jgi:hypothetical protein